MTKLDATGSVAAQVRSWLDRPQELIETVTKRPLENASRGLIAQLFDEEYIPGLFWISERVTDADFLKDENIRDYRDWISHMVHADLRSLKGCRDEINKLSADTIEVLVAGVLAAIELPYRGTALSACHTNQQADALIWRIMNLFIYGDPDLELPSQRSLNEIGRKTVTSILRFFIDLPIEEMWRIAIDAGMVGAGGKSQERFLSGHMTSLRCLEQGIPSESECGAGASQMLFEGLMRRRTEPLGIDFRPEYVAEVLASTGPRSVSWLTDDYIETIFDLMLIQAQLRVKPDLFITVIPRRGSYFHDASFEDIMAILDNERSLSKLADLYAAGRFHVCPAGPKTSCIDGRALSTEVATHLADSDAVVVKGARSFEMLQGLKKPTYYCLSGNCSFTESLTGLDMDLAQGILIRQDPGMLTYSDFKARARRRTRARNGREYGLAGMTSSEYAAARRSPSYKAHLERFNYHVNECNAWLLARARQMDSTFSEVTFGGTGQGVCRSEPDPGDSV